MLDVYPMILDNMLVWAISLYGIASFMTFIVYALDKSAAKNGRWRVKESTLHLLSVLGGWPGAFMAQKLLRHKSSKQPFRLIFFATIVLNIAIIIAIYRLSASII